MDELRELIKIEQLPVITEQFKEKKQEVEARLEPFKSLVVNEENRKEIKEIRAGLNKEAKEYDLLYRGILESVEAPIRAFKEAYRENIQSLYREADGSLKGSIDTIEQGLKDKKETAVKAYFYEYRLSLGNEYIDFASWERLGLKVGLSDSEKSLKSNCKSWLEQVDRETKTIVKMPLCDEIFTEYTKHLDLARAIETVNQREKEKEELQRKKEEQTRKDEEAKRKAEAIANAVGEAGEVIEHLKAPEIQVSEIQAPEQTEKVYTMAFKVQGTLAQMKMLKEFLESNKIKYSKMQ